MNDLLETTTALIETGNRSPRATAIAVLRALSATLRLSSDYEGRDLLASADWIDLQLDQLKPPDDYESWEASIRPSCQ